ncbi:Uncharacterised protein [Bordetella pertussis]|nr:Uncharacterised protein [Bordetella pertussis]
MRRQFVDGQGDQAFFGGVALERRAAHHRAVGIHQFAQHAGRAQARQGRQVHRAFGVAAPRQHTAWLRAQREYVSGADHVAAARARRDGGTDGGDAIDRRHAGGHAFACLDGHRKGRRVPAAVTVDHGRQLQAVEGFARQAQAHDAAAVADQLRHDGHGQLVGRDDQVGFVLAIEIVHQDDGAADAQVLQGALQARGERLGEQGENRGGNDVGH